MEVSFFVVNDHPHICIRLHLLPKRISANNNFSTEKLFSVSSDFFQKTPHKLETHPVFYEHPDENEMILALKSQNQKTSIKN